MISNSDSVSDWKVYLRLLEEYDYFSENAFSKTLS